MRVIESRHKLMFTVLALSGAWLLLPDIALAAQGLGEIGQRVGEQSTGAAFGVKRVLLLVGLILSGAGLVMAIGGRHSGKGVGAAIGMVVVGILLLSLVPFIKSGSATLFEDEGADQGISDLGLE